MSQTETSTTSNAGPSAGSAASAGLGEPVVKTRIEALHYGKFHALRDVDLDIHRGTITAFIGPSGCGKSTALRCINRMNDLIRGCKITGKIFFKGKDVYAPNVDPVAVRRHIGMVFQQPNPFSMSIFNNVAFGPRLNGFRGDLNELVETALRRAALWDEVKDKLRASGLSLSGGQQQRLCIARAIATEPEVLLMDEPCSALDPVATKKIEDLMLELKKRYTIVIVTHNLQQAARVADWTAFMYVDTQQGGRTGYLVEYKTTGDLFNSPQNQHTKDYLTGHFS